MNIEKFPTKWQEIDKERIHKFIKFVGGWLQEQPSDPSALEFLYLLHSFVAAVGEIERLQRLCSSNFIVTSLPEKKFIEKVLKEEDEKKRGE